MSVAIHIKVNNKLYNKDPQLSELGQKILKYSIILIDELGISTFTFKKLAEKIQSTEASIYRYFDNKHLLLHYLNNWYWEYVNARIEFAISNIYDPIVKLKKIFHVIITSSQRDLETEYIDEDILYRIILLEGATISHSKAVDEENAHGFFTNYKGIVAKISLLILEISPNYPFPRNTANLLLNVALNTKHNAQHLPRLTDIKYSDHVDDDLYDLLCHYLDQLVVKY
ncbi:MAG TPA: TetR/AcrR family transcriptional regulator [Saprospiraceae bacterium]|nr:TetR/AcrR family transcriptional regulator [Saprospiraceae bacterium]